MHEASFTFLYLLGTFHERGWITTIVVQQRRRPNSLCMRCFTFAPFLEKGIERYADRGDLGGDAES